MDGATHRLFCDTGERIMRHYSKYSHVGLEVVSEPYSEVTRDICLPRYRDTSILRRPTAYWGILEGRFPWYAPSSS